MQGRRPADGRTKGDGGEFGNSYHPGGSVVTNSPAVRETQEMRVWSLGWEDPLEEEMAAHFYLLAWRIPWIEPTGLQFMA